MNLFQQYIHLSRYSRWLEKENRRETWEETVARYFDFFTKHLKKQHNFDLSDDLRKELEQSILGMKVMPSMRCLMTAGPALERDNIAGYNCAFQGINEQKVFDEVLYILMNGTGNGFSVESFNVRHMPTVAEDFHPSNTVIVVDDSKVGWAKGTKELITLLYQGQIPKWDLSKLRPAGAKLKTFGGRASGPDPLDSLFRFLVSVFQEAEGRPLTNLECHDVICKIAEVVVVGGVRRSALISLSDLSDNEMRDAKSGAWWESTSHRSLANNSAVYDKKPSMKTFINEWTSLYNSHSGERGLFARYAISKQIERMNKFRKDVFGDKARMRDPNYTFGTNPCSEIILRDKQFCNLSEVVVRAEDTAETLAEKVRLATILGTFQSTLTNFKYISKKWKNNTEDERLLGVSLTGILDNTLTSGKELGPDGTAKLLEKLKAVAIDTNLMFAELIGIPSSTAITCVKPSGTVSALVGSASGIHTRHAPYYIRNVRADKKDPLAQLMVDMGFPVEDDVMKADHTYVFSFPTKAPENSVFRDDLTAIEHLELWKLYQLHWCEHKPSITISVKEDEWLDVGNWVYQNFDFMTGVSFLPFSEHIYRQAPFQECSEDDYNNLLTKMPEKVDWSVLTLYEKDDTTTGTQELSCAAGGCEIQ